MEVTSIDLLERHADSIARSLVARHYDRQPELELRYGPPGRAKCLRDAQYHLSYLCQAVAENRPGVFLDYVLWAREMLAARQIPGNDLALNLELLLVTLREFLPDSEVGPVAAIVEQALKLLASPGCETPSELPTDHPLAEAARNYLAKLLAGRRHEASQMVLDLIANGTPIRDVYLHIFQSSQYEIGRLWQLNRVSVAQEHYCTAATQLIMSLLYPQLFATERIGRTLVAASVGGDLHEIGVRVVADFFELEGWDAFYLGANSPQAALVETIASRKPDLLGLSATMPYHLRDVERAIAAVRAIPDLTGLKILVGGRAFHGSEEAWRKVGADGSAHDAAGAIELAGRLLQ